MSTAMKREKKPDVALVLSSGGPRGFAYIGAIEELLNRGYNITSIAGCSMGSLIGGIYASGHLDKVKEWLFNLDAWRVFQLLDLSISMNHVVKGDRVISEIEKIVPKVNIEDLNIPFCAVASDLLKAEEVVFERGDLFSAIRASISIPSLFRPIKYDNNTLVDGCLTNPIPLNRVKRKKGDILIAFDVNDVDIAAINEIIETERRLIRERASEEFDEKKQRKSYIEQITENKSLTFKDKSMLTINRAKMLFYNRNKENKLEEFKEKNPILESDCNYYSLTSRCFSVYNHAATKLMLQLYKPDVLIQMPFDRYGEISDYSRAREISELGRILTRDALDRYENR